MANIDIHFIEDVVVNICAITAFISLMLFIFDKKHREKLENAKVDKTIIIPIILLVIIIVLLAFVVIA